MKVGRNSVINSNISNFCSPDKFTRAHITRINPDKSTFLNSNLIVSNILNHLSPDHPPPTQGVSDAYANREVQMERDFQYQVRLKEKNNRVHNLARCGSQRALLEAHQKQCEMLKQVAKIGIMRIDISEKAKDIMSRKEDTAYLGRNIFLQGEKFLKQMKDCNPMEKITKVQATRMLMKERAKTKGRANRQVQRSATEEASSDIISPMPSSNHLNISVNYSTIEASVDKSYRRTESGTKERQQQLMGMIKNKSYQSVFAEQRRCAAWQGFADSWAQGFVKNDDLITTKKRRKGKKSPRQKYVQSGDNSQLDYHDKLSRHIALKKYRETFGKTAASYQILSQ